MLAAHQHIADGTHADLLVRTSAGDATAVGTLYEQYAGLVYATALMFSESHADAEDTVQDIFLGLPTALAPYKHRDRRGFEAWLRRMTANLALSKMRRRQRRALRLAEFEAHTAYAEDRDLDARIDLTRALTRLRETERLIVLLHDMVGFTHEEIGQALGITRTASRSRLARARRKLRRILRG
jgi:RNA polymerase sigma-70 factor (ECF subfamily)